VGPARNNTPDAAPVERAPSSISLSGDIPAPAPPEDV